MSMKGISILFAVLSLGTVTATQANLIVAPNANAAVEGNSDNCFPFLCTSGGMRYQQVFSSTEFSALSGPELITSITFRPDSPLGSAFSLNISSIDISLSSTSAAPDSMDSTFANNIGVDVTQVHSGALTLSTADVAGPGDTRAFDAVINFSTPFLYDPILGNLLLDVTKFSSETKHLVSANLMLKEQLAIQRHAYGVQTRMRSQEILVQTAWLRSSTRKQSSPNPPRSFSWAWAWLV